MSLNIENIRFAFDSRDPNEIRFIERESLPRGKIFEIIRKFYGSGKKTKLIKNFEGQRINILFSRWGEEIYCYVMTHKMSEQNTQKSILSGVLV